MKFIIILLLISLASCAKAVDDYEEFYRLESTCKKINEDLCSLRQLPEDDKSFAQFSKAQIIQGKKELLNRWCNEYNAKSQMITRSVWKAKKLPYELNPKSYNCYE